MPSKRKREIITFKVDPPLRDALRGIPNRSEFIRNALLAALRSVCPLCKGSGILTPDQRQHWNEFARAHRVEQCDDCHAVHLVCSAGDQNLGGVSPHLRDQRSDAEPRNGSEEGSR